MIAPFADVFAIKLCDDIFLALQLFVLHNGTTCLYIQLILAQKSLLKISAGPQLLLLSHVPFAAGGLCTCLRKHSYIMNTRKHTLANT